MIILLLLVKLDKAGCVYSMAAAVFFAQSSFPESDVAGLVCLRLFCRLVGVSCLFFLCVFIFLQAESSLLLSISLAHF